MRWAAKRQERLAVLSLDRDRRIAPIGYASSDYREPWPHSYLVEVLRTGRTVCRSSDPPTQLPLPNPTQIIGLLIIEEPDLDAESL